MASRQVPQVAWGAGEQRPRWPDVRQDDRDQWKITGALRRGEERMELSEPTGIVEGGFLVARGKIARLDDGGAFPWLTRLITLKQIPFPHRERKQVMSKPLDLNWVPPPGADAPRRSVEPR